ncbi:rCG57620 [Rattus norvegicus]|uniref:RCG57620 n=1 Tax=Rattus norvegicus TaxID=10116 RepID=A6JHH0_RAT|nr:rCG57620 [Rattus norvegicus]
MIYFCIFIYISTDKWWQTTLSSGIYKGHLYKQV